jgi:hypothetical protein
MDHHLNEPNEGLDPSVGAFFAKQKESGLPVMDYSRPPMLNMCHIYALLGGG